MVECFRTGLVLAEILQHHAIGKLTCTFLHHYLPSSSILNEADVFIEIHLAIASATPAPTLAMLEFREERWTERHNTPHAQNTAASAVNSCCGESR